MIGTLHTHSKPTVSTSDAAIQTAESIVCDNTTATNTPISSHIVRADTPVILPTYPNSAADDDCSFNDLDYDELLDVLRD